MIAVALNKLSVFVSATPEDNTPIKWAKGSLFAFATGVQVVLMNAPLKAPNHVECQQECPLKYCRLGVSIISSTLPSNKDSNSTRSRLWPQKASLPTNRYGSGWLVLDKEDACAHELMLSRSQMSLFTLWTVIMSIFGVAIAAMLVYSMNKIAKKDETAQKFERQDEAGRETSQAPPMGFVPGPAGPSPAYHVDAAGVYLRPPPPAPLSPQAGGRPSGAAGQWGGADE